MKNRYTFGILCLWLWSYAAGAQSIPWTIYPTGSNHTIFIRSSTLPTTHGTILEAGDAIGVFYDSLGVMACGGYVEWTGQSTFLVAYGADGSLPGYRVGEGFQFRVWKKAINCITENVEVTYATGGVNTHAGNFASDGISELSSLRGRSSRIAYADTLLCGNAAPQTPMRQGAISRITFRGSAGLALDETTGIIDVASSQPGEYTVLFQSPVCLEQTSTRVRIASKIDVGGLTTRLTDATCRTQRGSLEIDENSISGGRKPYRFVVREVNTRALVSSTTNQFPQLEPGVYELLVSDAQGCQVTANSTLRVTHQSDCVPVITPDNDGVADAFYIPEAGTAKVYNRHGQLQKTLTVPGDWYGTDETGSPVPMGSYVILCNGEARQFVVTVVR